MTNPLKLNSKAKKIGGAIVVIASGIAFPAYFGRTIPWERIQLTPFTVGIAFLYIAVVAGFVAAVFGHTGGNITSTDTDKKIALRYRKIVGPIRLAIIVVLLCFAVYWAWQVWNLMGKA